MTFLRNPRDRERHTASSPYLQQKRQHQSPTDSQKELELSGLRGILCCMCCARTPRCILPEILSCVIQLAIIGFGRWSVDVIWGAD